MKHHVHSVHNGSESDQYVVQNMKWLGVYLRRTLSNTLLQKVLTLVPLTATGPEAFVATFTTFISNSYDSLKETLTHIKSLKQNIYPGEKVTYLCATIFVYYDRGESVRAFKPDHLGCTTRIFEYTSDSRFRL